MLHITCHNTPRARTISQGHAVLSVHAGNGSRRAEGRANDGPGQGPGAGGGGDEAVGGGTHTPGDPAINLVQQRRQRGGGRSAGASSKRYNGRAVAVGVVANVGEGRVVGTALDQRSVAKLKPLDAHSDRRLHQRVCTAVGRGVQACEEEGVHTRGRERRT
jgi:hypothetical protein